MFCKYLQMPTMWPELADFDLIVKRISNCYPQNRASCPSSMSRGWWRSELLRSLRLIRGESTTYLIAHNLLRGTTQKQSFFYCRRLLLYCDLVYCAARNQLVSISAMQGDNWTPTSIVLNIAFPECIKMRKISQFEL